MASTTKSTPINIRIDNVDLAAARQRAAEEGIGYQTYLRRLIASTLRADALDVQEREQYVRLLVREEAKLERKFQELARDLASKGSRE